MSKPAPAPDESAGSATPVASGAKKKKMIIFALIGLIVLAGGGGAAAFFMGQKDHGKKEAKKTEKVGPAVFLPLENFVVNLQSENGDRYLQVGITLQVKNDEQLAFYKSNLPQLRSRILLLLSSRSAENLLTNEGKVKLSSDIIKQAQLPYNKEELSAKEVEDRKISGVYFTSFMIQ